MRVPLSKQFILLSLFAASIAVLLAIVIVSGAYDFAADDPHWAITKNLIAYERERSITARMDGIVVPKLDDPHMLSEGVEHYDAMCTACHLAPGMAENEMRPGMNPRPPVLWQMKQGDPARQFWIVKHGIKMTGMPAWGATHSDDEIWNMVALLQKLPALSPRQYRALVAASGGHHEHDMDMSR